MLQQIVKDSLECMSSYHIPNEADKFQMVYNVARIERDLGKSEAMTQLNVHLDKHYRIKESHLYKNEKSI